MSVEASLEFLHLHVPGFPALRRAASWPRLLAGPLVVRWLRHHRHGSGAASAAGTTVQAVRLVLCDDREFCRRVHLENWRFLADSEDTEFELMDESSELLWPVALRALLLFGGARVDDILPPGAADRRRTDESPRHRIAVRTRATTEGGFHVALMRPPHSPPH